ncbi:MAG: hypothetical protein PVH61_34205 [Candidatus Aminicenantes bacterium]|jgi:hypothetical protein
MRTVTTLIDEDHYSRTEYFSGVDGSGEYKFMEITYTRTK